MIPNILKVNLIFHTVIQVIAMLIVFIRYQLSIPDADDSGSVKLCQIFLVGHQHYQFVPGDGMNHVHDFDGVAAVQISRRLIGNDDSGILTMALAIPTRCRSPPDSMSA